MKLSAIIAGLALAAVLTQGQHTTVPTQVDAPVTLITKAAYEDFEAPTQGQRVDVLLDQTLPEPAERCFAGMNGRDLIYTPQTNTLICEEVR